MYMYIFMHIIEVESQQLTTFPGRDYTGTSHPLIAYRKTSSISRTKSQSLNVFCIIVHLLSLNPLKPGVKLRMKM